MLSIRPRKKKLTKSKEKGRKPISLFGSSHLAKFTALQDQLYGNKYDG
jgi:hypothetical protein